MSITEVINKLIAEWGIDPQAINHGRCIEFAQQLQSKLGGELQWDNPYPWPGIPHPLPTHCFLKLNNKYYDAECPNGVERWEQLPYFVRYFCGKF